jgi:DNA-binding transcriptional regulator YiaG
MLDATEIRAIRTRAGLTQVELADALQVNEMTVSRWERGLSRPHRYIEQALRRLDTSLPRMETPTTQSA